MSNFEAWKAAKTAFEDTEAPYNAAHQAVAAAGEKRDKAWGLLVKAAGKLSPDERKQAAEYQYGPSVSSNHPREISK